MRLLRILPLVLSALFTAAAARAQVFIPDQLERDWLNGLIPGIVDAGGVMDTLHPGIAQVDSAMFLFNSVPASIDLVGIAYLSALERFNLHSNVPFDGLEGYLPIVIEGFPLSLRRLDISVMAERDVEIHLPILPPQMDWIKVDLSFASGWLDIAALPEYVGRMELARIDSLSWPGTGHTGRLYLTEGGDHDPMDLTIPSLIVDGRVELWFPYINRLDMSAVTCDDLNIQHGIINGDVRWPMAESMWFSMSEIRGGLPPFPPTLRTLDVDLTIIRCLPVLPEGLLHLRDHNNMIPCFPNWPEGMVYFSGSMEPITQETATYCSILNSTCPGAYPGIAGRVFIDTDGDGTHSPGEPPLRQASVTLQPNGNVVGCRPDGTWEIGVQPGAYTITAASGYPYLQSISPAQHTADVPNMGDADTGNDFAVTLIPDIQDLRVNVYADPARPGFGNNLHLRCENYGTTTVDAEVTLALAPDQIWVSSSVPPASQTGNTATWNFPAMPIGAVQHIVVELHTDVSVPLGTSITHTLTAEPTATDETPLNNIYTFTDSVVGSYDPNDKLLSPAVLTPDEVAAGDKPITYTIRFQNTGTYHAERVVILDTLSEDLQWSSMRFIASSHAHEWYIRDGVLHVIHDGIMLPDSTADEPGSHGFFTFSMLPATDLGQGSTIGNIAHIVFDFNEPIVTPPAVFTVDVSAGVQRADRSGDLRILPNPAHDRIKLRMDGTAPMVYRIVDVLGQQVAQGAIAPDSWLDVQALPAGAYIMDVQRGSVRSSARFVKQ